MKNKKYFFKKSITFVLGFIVYFLSVFNNAYTVTTQTCPSCHNKRVLTIKEENPLWYQLKNFYPKKEKKFVVIIPSYNNKDWYKNNLDSVFMQNYDNYRVIYIDDASPDGTGALVENYIKENKLENKITLIKNKENQGCMANWHSAIHSCQNDEIVVNLDGDDCLAHDHVLALLNKVYSCFDVWLTYGQFKFFPQNKMGNCKAASTERVANNNFRIEGMTWIFSHLRTFYVWLFKKINIEDLMRNGVFFPYSCDQAMMLPMLEMAGFKSMFIPDILYLYNTKNPLSHFQFREQSQYDAALFIQNKERYKILEEATSFKTINL